MDNAMSSKETNPNPHPPAIAVVVPVHNEEDNIQPLVSEIAKPGPSPPSRRSRNDGSTDRTCRIGNSPPPILPCGSLSIKSVDKRHATASSRQGANRDLTATVRTPGRYPGLDGRVGNK